MSQVSRPVQIGLLVVLLIGALWFVALRPHSQTASTPAPAPVAAAPPAAPAAPKPLNTQTPVVGGLFGAVNKANAAVAASAASAASIERQAAADNSATNPAPSAPVTTASSSAAAPAAAAPTTHATPAPSTQTSSPARTATTPATAPAAANPAVTIGDELTAGKTVALLFWNPLATDDRAVRDALQALVKPHGPLVVHYATADQVTDYGSIVTAEQVLETPTLLVMKGKSITTITDLQDPSDLRQYFGNFVQGGPGQVLTPTLAAYAVGTTRAAYIAKANALCKRLNAKEERTFASLSSTTTAAGALKLAVTLDQSYLAALRAIPVPVADRAYLHTTWVALDRAFAEALAEIPAVSAGNDYLARNLVLSTQSNVDLAYNRLDAYGLSYCAGPDSPNLTP